MNWFAAGLMLLSRIPLDRLLVKGRDPMEEVKHLSSLFNKAGTSVVDPTNTAALPQKAPPNEASASAINTAETPGTSPKALPNKRENSGVSTAETILYQKRELSKELLLLEKHLQQSCKIAGKACDCCTKHPIAIEALAQEALGMTGDLLFTKVAEWATEIAPMTTVEASKSGKYEETYSQLAVKARELRKKIMGTDDVEALLTPELYKKVQAQVKNIVGSTMNNEGGDNG